MTRRLVIVCGFLLLAVMLAACGDEGGTPANGQQGSGGEPPSAFEEARDALASRLEAIGANIGSVPDDVRADLLEGCDALTQYAEEDDVEPICSGIERAMDTGDFGLVDLVLEELQELGGG